MPIYEYACDNCEQELEVEQRITDAPLKTCPSCRSRKLRRLISRTSFVLKGGGWYSDLYASPGSKPEKGEAASDAGGGSKGSEAKSEPKPEASPADSKAPEKPKKKKGAKAAA